MTKFCKNDHFVRTFSSPFSKVVLVSKWNRLVIFAWKKNKNTDRQQREGYSLLEYDGLRLCRYWDTEILGLLREIMVITDTEKYWDTGVNWAFAKKRGYLDTGILGLSLRYWDTELQTQIMRYCGFNLVNKDTKTLRYRSF